MDPVPVEQLRRQSLWLKDSWLWLMRGKVLGPDTKTALEVGCGAGHVMEILSEHLDVKGLDNDPDMVSLCREKGLDVCFGDAGELPFGDSSFDIVYCSFLLLWLPEPEKAVEEMARVSRKWVVCLGEPDYGARIDYPAELEALGQAFTEDLARKGADPFVGRKLRSIIAKTGLTAEIGVHQGIWPVEKTLAEAIRELREIDRYQDKELRSAAEKAAAAGGILQYNPVFWALARK